MDQIPAGAIPVEQFKATQAPQMQNSAAVPPGAIPVDQFQSSEDVYGGVGQQALTTAEGLGQGLLGPVATGAERGLSALGVPGLTPQEQEARAKENPILRYGSEAAGFGLGSFLGTGEAALAAKAGDVAVNAARLGEATTTGAKIAGAGIRGAAEVGTIGAGNEISKLINQDPNQTLGSAAINIGLSGILGGAGGAALGSVSPLWKSLTGKAAAETISEPLAKTGEEILAENRAPAVTDTLTNAIQDPAEKESFLEGLKKQKPNAQEIIDAGQTIGVPVSPAQTSASDYVQSLDSALGQSPTIAGVMRRNEIDSGFEKIGNIIDQTLGSAEETTPYQRGQTIKDQLTQVKDDLYAPLKQGYANRAAAMGPITFSDESLIKQFNKLDEIGQSFGKKSPEAEKIIKDAAQGLLKQENAGDIDEWVKVLKEDQRNLRMSGKNTAAIGLGNAIDSIEDFQIKQIAKQAAGVAGPEGEAIAQELVRQHQDLKSKYSEFKGILNDLSSDAKLGRKATTDKGLDEILDKIPNEKLVDKMFDPKNFDGLQRLKDKFPKVFDTVIQGKKSDLLNAAMKNGELDTKALLKNLGKLSPEIRSLMFNEQEMKLLDASKTWIDSLPKNVGPSGTPKGLAYMEAAKGHPISMIANNLHDFGVRQLLKFATPTEIESNKIAADYLNHAQSGEKLLDRATKAFFSTGKLIPEHLLPTEEKRKKLSDRVTEIQDPHKIMSVGGKIGDYMPNHLAGATQIAAQASQYLNSLKPNETAANPIDKAPPIDKAQQTKYNRALDIAEQPLLVLQHAHDGTLLPQDIQTMQAIYPALHSAIVTKLTDELVNNKALDKEIPYRKRQSLSMLIGTPIDSTMKQPYMQAVISSAAGQMTQEQRQQNSRHATQAAIKQSDKVDALYQTPLEARATDKRA